jgi:hypothetical protein
MLWPRRTCAFGLPDEDEDAAIGDIVSVAIGHVLRVTAADIVDAPLPGRLIALLRQLERRQLSTGASLTVLRKRAICRRGARRKPIDLQVDASAVGDVVGPLMADDRLASARAGSLQIDSLGLNRDVAAEA